MTSCLVIDCSGQVISVALAREGAGADAGIWSETLEQKHGQAEVLAPLAERVFQRSSLNDWTELEHVVVCRGPGGFTGLRIGVAFALGLTAGAPHVKLWGMATDAYWLSQLSHRKVAGDRPLICAVDTRRDDFYWKDLNAVVTDWMIAASVDDLPAAYADALFVGNAPMARDHLDDTQHWREEIDTAYVAQASLDPSYRSAYLADDTTPLYVRAPAISKANRVS